jgi:hypothetical protein
VGVLELGHGTDVPGGEPLYLEPLLPLLHRQVVQLFDRLVLGVKYLAPVLELARVEAEERHVADVRLG